MIFTARGSMAIPKNIASCIIQVGYLTVQEKHIKNMIRCIKDHRSLIVTQKLVDGLLE